VRDWFDAFSDAQDQGLTRDEALASLEETPTDDAFHAWNEAMGASLNPPQDYA
jgi:hypothetical protein